MLIQHDVVLLTEALTLSHNNNSIAFAATVCAICRYLGVQKYVRWWWHVFAKCYTNVFLFHNKRLHRMIVIVCVLQKSDKRTTVIKTCDCMSTVIFYVIYMCVRVLCSDSLCAVQWFTMCCTVIHYVLCSNSLWAVHWFTMCCAVIHYELCIDSLWAVQ